MKGKKVNEIEQLYEPFTLERGIALMMVLWVLVLLSIIALNYFGSNRWNSAATRNLKEETLAYAMAMSGYQEAVNYVLSDKDPAVDFIDSEGHFWTDADAKTQPVTGLMTTEDGEVEIKITDENARININKARANVLTSLFLYVGIPDDEITELLDCIADWKDSPAQDRDATMASGAESDYYEGLSDSYVAKNGEFTVPEELALVKGMKPEYFKAEKTQMAEDGVKSLLPLITTFGGNSPNINTVSKDVMQVLGLDESQIEAVMKQRTREVGGFKTPPGLNIQGVTFSVKTQIFRIEVAARTKSSNLGMKIIAVLNRKPDLALGGYKIQTLYWREDVENIRG